jgi:hypothetical protein
VGMSAKWANRAIVSIVILVALASGVSRLVAQTGPPDSLLHLEVLVRHPDGEPVGYLTTKDFVVTEGGQRLPVQVVLPRFSTKVGRQPTIPTRMLVIVDAPTANSPDGFSRIVTALGPVWRRGWQVAVARIDGNASSYTGSAGQLRRNLAALAGSSMRTTAAVDNLGSFLGRRVVLFAGDVGQDEANIPRWLHSKAQDAMAELIVADTGRSPRKSDDGDVLGILAHGAENGGGALPEMASGRLSLRGAIQKALHGALGYYDLRLSLLGNARPVVCLQIQKAQDMKVLSQVFGPGTTPELRISTK